MDGRNKVEVWKTGEIIMNSVNLTGRVTKDIELSTTKSGQSVASFNLAVNDHRDKNGNEVAYFIRIVVWGNWAKVCHQWAKKGTLIGVSGKLTSNVYTTKQGEKRYITEVVAHSIDLLARPKQQDNDKPNTTPAVPTSDSVNQDMSRSLENEDKTNISTIESESSTSTPDFNDLNFGLEDNDLDVPF